MKQELKYNGMLVKELAAISGVQKRALDTYLLAENASMPPADTAVKIANALGISVEYLVTGNEKAFPEDIRHLLKDMLRLDIKDRKIVNTLVHALLERKK